MDGYQVIEWLCLAFVLYLISLSSTFYPLFSTPKDSQMWSCSHLPPVTAVLPHCSDGRAYNDQDTVRKLQLATNQLTSQLRGATSLPPTFTTRTAQQRLPSTGITAFSSLVSSPESPAKRATCHWLSLPPGQVPPTRPSLAKAPKLSTATQIHQFAILYLHSGFHHKLNFLQPGTSQHTQTHTRPLSQQMVKWQPMRNFVPGL